MKQGDPGLAEVLYEVLPGLEVGDVIYIHDADCPAWGDETCDCEPIMVRGPSAKA